MAWEGCPQFSQLWIRNQKSACRLVRAQVARECCVRDSYWQVEEWLSASVAAACWDREDESLDTPWRRKQQCREGPAVNYDGHQLWHAINLRRKKSVLLSI